MKNLIIAALGMVLLYIGLVIIILKANGDKTEAQRFYERCYPKEAGTNVFVYNVGGVVKCNQVIRE